MIRLRDAPAGRLTGARRHRAGTGRVVLPLALSRHEVTLVELAPVVGGAPPRSDERRRPGREAA
ncbi:hypothetical protein QF034_006302 [Streptomyces africanus]|uniref:Uncharacterized protein n=1 Tax=Streptomyces africanus TaxID=231024 RepID=A0ABU0QXF6_9ACTN|nr:hypothetical protein [Streptomyces africanus]MDQ0752071.1 hypothetical protein [Streptomyces africanus]